MVLQAAWKGHKQRKAFLERKAYLKAQEDKVVRMQARVRGRIARGQYLGRLSVFKSNEDLICFIQVSHCAKTRGSLA